MLRALPPKSILHFPKSTMNVIASKPVSTATRHAITTSGNSPLPRVSRVDIAHALSVPLLQACPINRLLDSDFNLPANVTIEFDVNNANNVNLQPLSSANNPQVGSLIPEAFKDTNLNTTADHHAVSGYVSISYTAENKTNFQATLGACRRVRRLLTWTH